MDQNVSFKIQLSKREHEAPSTNRMCSKFKEANDFLKWQESDVREMARTFMEKMRVQKIMN